MMSMAGPMHYRAFTIGLILFAVACFASAANAENDSSTGIADEDSSYRWLWTLPAVEVGADAPWWMGLYDFVDVRRTPDGGHLILARQLPSYLFNIKLDSKGQVEFWTTHEWCQPDDECPQKREPRPEPLRMPDGSFWFQSRSSDDLIKVSFDGTSEERFKISYKISPYGIDALIAPDDAIYVANHWFGMYDSDIAALLRLNRDGGENWALKVPLRLDGEHVFVERSELGLLANGDILWWIDGGPVINTGPWRDYVMRVAPNGDIRPPGLLERSVPAEGDAWRVIGHHLLPDGRLLRYGEWLEGSRKGFLYLELWDGTGGTLLGRNLVDLDDAAHPLQWIDGGDVLAARGTHNFYMGGFWVDGGSLIVGFTADGSAAWRKIVPGGVISHEATSSIYVTTCDRPDPALYSCGIKFYITDIE